MADFTERRLSPNGALFSTGTRAQYAPSSDFVNVSLDYNAAPSGTARGTEVIVPDNASPQVRAAAEAYNNAVVSFARSNGIADYPNRGVRTRSENGRGVSNTVHTEPFFNSDSAMQRAIQANPEAFASIYQDAFGGISNARVIAPHGMGADRGATSEIFGTETDFGRMILGNILNGTTGMPAVSGDMSSLEQRSPDQGVSQSAFSAALARLTSQSSQDSSATEPSNAPNELTMQDRLAGVGAALSNLDQGLPVAPPPMGSGGQIDLSEILDKLRKSPIFNQNKGLSL